MSAHRDVASHGPSHCLPSFLVRLIRKPRIEPDDSSSDAFAVDLHHFHGLFGLEKAREKLLLKPVSV